jgi:hypothetical protein
MCWAVGPATGAIFERGNPAGAEPCKCVAMSGVASGGIDRTGTKKIDPEGEEQFCTATQGMSATT